MKKLLGFILWKVSLWAGDPSRGQILSPNITASAGSRQMFFPTQIWPRSKSLWQATHRQLEMDASDLLTNWIMKITMPGRCGQFKQNQGFPSHLQTLRILGRFFWSHSREHFPGAKEFNIHLQLISTATICRKKIFPDPTHPWTRNVFDVFFSRLHLTLTLS